MKKRYERNMNMLSQEESDSLKKFNVCVVGCGGLGGYIIEFLGRLGIGNITAVDGDVFDETNLNRQLLSDETVIGLPKAVIARTRMFKVNSEIIVNSVQEMLTEKNAEQILTGHHIILDALDNTKSRRILEKYCEKLAIPLVHGAIGGWFAQVCVIMPGDNVFEKIYPNDESGQEAYYGNPSFTPATCASIQVCETVKVLLQKGDILNNKLLTINLLNHEYEIFNL